MKNITILPVLVIIILSFSAINPVFCQDNIQITGENEEFSVNHGQTTVYNNWKAESAVNSQRRYGVTLGPQFGFLNGKAIELVYPIITKYKYLSELLWDIKFLYLGLNIDVGLNDIMSGKGFFSSLSFKAGFPGDSGIIEDRDWMSVKNSGLTHYSRHTNKMHRFLQADLLLGASIPVSTFSLKPFVNLSWMNFSFSARDGYGTYARKLDEGVYLPITENPDKRDYTGRTVITYEQNWLLLAPGFSFGIITNSPFSIDLSFQISPFTLCIAEDQHLGSPLRIFNDYTGLGLFFEGGGKVSFIWKFLELSLEFSYRYIGNTKKGVTYLTEYNITTATSDTGGAGLSLMDTRFIFKVRL